MTPALIVVLVLVSLTLTTISGVTLWWMMHAWRTPEANERTGFPAADEPELSFSIIMPCRDERYDVMATTLRRLLTQSHPRVEVVLSVGDDDETTVGFAHRLAALHPGRVKVSVNTDPVKNKPRQLNTALAVCTGDVVGIVDAESITAPGLLARVDTTFRARNADVVQGAVHLVNYRARWFTLRNCMEYRVYFRSRLHGHADAGFIPLGGNTVFVWRSLLEEVGGWDGDCLAEDCEIGVRLSVLRKKVVCVYDPSLVTLEEAPESVPSFVKQRTRWALGFMQVLAKGEWRRLPTRRQRLSAWWTLVQQYAMAFTGVVLPLGVVAALTLKVPSGVALLTYLPLMPALVTIGFELFLLHEFGRHMAFKITVRDYVKLVVTTPFYQVLLAWSAVRAVVKYARGDFAWAKTAHTGAHLHLVDEMADEMADTTVGAPETIDLTMAGGGGARTAVPAGAGEGVRS